MHPSLYEQTLISTWVQKANVSAVVKLNKPNYVSVWVRNSSYNATGPSVPWLHFYSPPKKKKKPWWRQFAFFTSAWQEYFPHYPIFKHRALYCHKRKWLWQKMSNQRLSAGFKSVWCGLNQLVKSNERSKKRWVTQELLFGFLLNGESQAGHLMWGRQTTWAWQRHGN